MDMNLIKFQEVEKDRVSWYVAVIGSQRVGLDLATEYSNSVSYFASAHSKLQRNSQISALFPSSHWINARNHLNEDFKYNKNKINLN